MTTEAPRARFPWGLTIVSAIAFALLCGLGVWQVQRLQWKEGLIAEADAAAARPPVPLDAAIAEGGTLEFRRVTLACTGLATAPYVELQTIADGQPGVRLISACRPPRTRAAFLVDRGFVPEEVSARPQVRASTEVVTVTGQLRRPSGQNWMTPAPAKNRFYARDRLAMARALGVTAPVAPELVYATTSTNPDWKALAPSAPPVAFANNHLGYAITWFGLALALAGVYIALLRRRLTS